MFEQRKLVRLWREGYDFCLLARLASVTENDADAVGQLQSGPGGASELSWLAELCEPLMIMYAQNLPLPSSLRQEGIRGLPKDKLEMDLHRTYGRLLRSMHAWMTKVRPEKQLHTLQRVLGARAYWHADELAALARELKSTDVRGTVGVAIASGFNQRTG